MDMVQVYDSLDVSQNYNKDTDSTHYKCCNNLWGHTDFRTDLIDFRYVFKHKRPINYEHDLMAMSDSLGEGRPALMEIMNFSSLLDRMFQGSRFFPDRLSRSPIDQ